LNGRLLSSLYYLMLSKEQGKDENTTAVMRIQAEKLKDLLTGKEDKRLTKLDEISRVNKELEKVGTKPVK
jgi:hypothetical protein